MAFKKDKKEKIKKAGVKPVASDTSFANIKFAGTFREYQQRVINNSAKYIKEDRKIHIVAAPGSGKTILGLELVRSLGKPALILSPTIAIREQWKARFEEMFVPAGRNVDDFVSCTLKKPKLLTSITYQGLYSCYAQIEQRKASAKLKSEDDEDFEEEQEFYTGIDIIELMKQHQISTICLDEAHHLRAEWQKALTQFINQVKHDVTIIALTATPPYDSKKSEWDKYIDVCGPIDEEIFVPELVRTKTLCPHQDYIYYNFPTKDEEELVEKYQQTVNDTVAKVFEEGKFLEIIKNSEFFKDPEEFSDELFDRQGLVKAILAFFEQSKEKTPKRLRAMLERDDRDIVWDLSVAEILFQGMISDDQLFDIKDREFVKGFLSRYGLVEKSVVTLLSTSELEKLLFSSIGKLKSIERIVEEESKNLGDKIRLLILTDYIRVNSAVLGSDKEIKEMGVVPIFEMIRRKNPELRISAISGKIVIVPNVSLEGVKKIAAKDNITLKAVAIKGTEHSELIFSGLNSANKIAVMTRAFNEGIINGIVGTKSLLGEGWDSPVINTLILASFVGSFMLSNQMRGRAIRVDKNDANKVGNIWHLTAILPQHLIPEVSANIPPSADYAVLERRFHGFMGLNYDINVIESSLARAMTLRAPYDEKNIDRANEATFKLAAGREEVAKRWRLALVNSSNEVVIQNEIPKPKKGFIPSFIIKPTHFSTIKKVTHAVVKTFKELSLIERRAKLVIEKNYKTKTVNVGICRCSKYEKSIFHQAVSEVLGHIDSPKYILVKTKAGKLDYRASFAVPEIFSSKKDTAEVFNKRMSRRIADFELFFTRSNDGKKHLSGAKKRAYVNRANNEIQAKMKLREGSV